MSTFEVINPIFASYVLGNAPLKKIATGFDWVEGPVWMGDANCLLFSDIPNNRILRWIPGDQISNGAGTGLSVYREPSNYSNGHTRDRQGRLVSCEHGSRSVTRTEHDGSITTLVDNFEGKRFNSPNDVVVKSDGSIWFTDPHYGIMSNYEGYKSEQELSCNVYRLNPESGKLDVMASDFGCPNGLAFNSDESRLYVSDTGLVTEESPPTHIRMFDVAADGSLSGGNIFHEINPGLSDGFRLDTDDNIWSSAADGVHCISKEGELLGKVLVPELVSNVCFCGRSKHQLFITASTSVYCISLNRQGIQTP